jgi:hypothetical protein
MSSGADTLVLMIGDPVERIEVHRRWQASLGAEGECLSLIGEDLRGVDLKVPNCSAPSSTTRTSTGQRWRGRVLGNAYLGASLRGADLTELLAYFLVAGAVVSFSTGLPPIPWVYG